MIDVDRYAVIGHPVAHSLSPLIHSVFAKECGETLRYDALDLTAEQFDSGVREFVAAGGSGLNVTVPHKLRAFELCDAVSVAARVGGAVNTILVNPNGTLVGDITDGLGLVTDLTLNLGEPLAGKRVLILGAGGTVLGCLGPLLGLEPAAVLIANRTRDKALAVAHNFQGFGNVTGCGLDEIDNKPFDAVINATSASLLGDDLEVPPAVVDGALCYDVMYAAGGTGFTDWGRQHGARSVHTGVGMLVEQAAASFYLWRGKRPATRPVLDRLARDKGLSF